MHFPSVFTWRKSLRNPPCDGARAGFDDRCIEHKHATTQSPNGRLMSFASSFTVGLLHRRISTVTEITHPTLSHCNHSARVCHSPSGHSGAHLARSAASTQPIAVRQGITEADALAYQASAPPRPRNRKREISASNADDLSHRRSLTCITEYRCTFESKLQFLDRLSRASRAPKSGISTTGYHKDDKGPTFNDPT